MDIKRIFLILPLEILYEIVTYVYVPVEINDIGYKGYKNKDKSVKKLIKSCELILNRYKSYDVGFLYPLYPISFISTGTYTYVTISYNISNGKIKNIRFISIYFSSLYVLLFYLLFFFVK